MVLPNKHNCLHVDESSEGFCFGHNRFLLTKDADKSLIVTSP